MICKNLPFKRRKQSFINMEKKLSKNFVADQETFLLLYSLMIFRIWKECNNVFIAQKLPPALQPMVT